MGGGGKRVSGPGPNPASPAKPARPANKKPQVWRIRGWRVRNLAAGGALFILFAIGFYLAQLYGEISALIEQRRAALTSAIYSAPHPIRVGDDVERSALLDRLAQLRYSRVPVANTPGADTKATRATPTYLRPFRCGA